MSTTKYLDLAGLQYLKTKMDKKYVTSADVTTAINTALETYKQGIVTIVSSLPSTGEEGKLYLVPDPNASSNDVYTTWAWEESSWAQMGSTALTITVDSTVIEDSTNPVSGGAVYDELALKVNLSDVTGSVTQNDTNPVTSGGVYTELQYYVTTASIASSVTSDDTNAVSGGAVATYVTGALDDYVEESRVTGSAPASDSTDICTSGAMYTALGFKVDESRVTSSAPADDSTDICTSGAIYDALELKLDASELTSSITENGTNAVTSGAIYDALALKLDASDVESITNSDIDLLFAENALD